MAVFPAPYRVMEAHKCDSPETCEFVGTLPEDLRKAALDHPFLLSYLHRLPVSEIGMPLYRDDLSRSDGESESPNFIYPTKVGGIFIHILADKLGGRAHYIAVEPAVEHPQHHEIMADIEEALLDYTDMLEASKGDEQLGLVLRWALDKIFGQTPEMDINDILALPVPKHVDRNSGAPAQAAQTAPAEASAASAQEGEGEAADGAVAGVATATATAERAESKKPGSRASFLRGGPGNGGKSLFAPLSRLMSRGKKTQSVNLVEKWSLDRNDVAGIKYSLVKEKVGVGVLQPLINDHWIEDISCSGLGALFIEHKVFKSMRTSFGYRDYAELDQHVLRLSERIKKPVTFRQPVVDATLPDGSRINIVYGKDVSTRGSNYTIRKFAEEPISILQLCKWGSLSWEMAAYLSLCIEDGMNMFVSGETASGKTTLMNALTTFIEPNAKIVSIEDTAEVNVPHGNWIREVTRKPKPGEQDSGVGMFDLLKAALRQRPNEIIIGEIRGEEGLIAFQAMQTGHPVMATFHAASIQKLIQRLVGDPILVPKNYVDNLNIAVIQIAVRLPNGKLGRRAVSINEIVNYDSQTDSFSFVEVFRWDPVTDTFDFTGFNNSFILEQKIAAARGYPPARRRQIYSLVKRRARILEKLANSGLEEYYEVYRTISKAIHEGVF